jgi:hypothetical protein
MARECQEKNARGLTMVAVGMNKAADELMILDEATQEALASGKYRDQRRGSFGTSPSAAPEAPAARGAAARGPVARGPAARGAGVRDAAVRAGRPRRAEPPRRPGQRPVRRPWSRKQEKLALLYNEQGLRPAEIAEKLGVSSYLVTQIILAAKNRGKL